MKPIITRAELVQQQAKASRQEVETLMEQIDVKLRQSETLPVIITITKNPVVRNEIKRLLEKAGYRVAYQEGDNLEIQ